VEESVLDDSGAEQQLSRGGFETLRNGAGPRTLPTPSQVISPCKMSRETTLITTPSVERRLHELLTSEITALGCARE